MKPSIRCTQCWKHRSPAAFVGARGGMVQRCAACRKRYTGWDSLSVEERIERLRTHIPVRKKLRARLFRKSGNRKLGGIPCSITSRNSCPKSYAFYGRGCYAEYHVLAKHWRRVGDEGDSWEEFLDDVQALPRGQVWRHNVAGDLPGEGEAIDCDALSGLVVANAGRRGFTFTHKPVGGTLGRTVLSENLAAVQDANASGFTVNLSANSLSHADRLARGSGPRTGGG